jgi:hypothetical protein
MNQCLNQFLMKQNLSQASIEPLLNYLDRLIPLSQEEKELVADKFQPRLFRNKQFALQEGRFVQPIYFRCKGLLTHV